MSQIKCSTMSVMQSVSIARLLGIVVGGGSSAQPSSDMAEFRQVLSKAKHIVVLSGAGVSAESGVPTFRGAGGYWRTFQVSSKSLKIII